MKSSSAIDPSGEAVMTAASYLIIVVCFVCNMLDGMDALIISYTAPAIASAWSIPPGSLGIVFSSGLIGMTVGAIFLAPFADQFGRKPLMMVAAAVMGICIYATSLIGSMTGLIALRFLSGLGIGIMMANTAAITAEYAPSQSRNFWVSLVVAGYPVGATLTGLFSASVIQESGWQHLYVIAGLLTALILPIIYFLLNESQEFKQNAKTESARLAALFNPERKWGTIQLWIALFFSFSTLYFLLNWIPKLASNAGLSLDKAIHAGTIFNLGAIVGIPIQGFLSGKLGLKKTVGTILIVTAVMLGSFGLFAGSDWILLILFFLGFGVQSGFVGLFAASARMYPTAIRTTGVGWALGIGRLGGIIGPILGGFLVALGLGMTESFAVFAIPSLVAGLLTLKISSTSIS